MLTKILTLVFCGSLIFSFAEKTIIYNKNTGDKDVKAVWSLEREGNMLHVQSQSVDQTFMIDASIPYSVQKFNMVSHKNSNRYTFTRSGSTLKAEGKRRGNDLKESYQIGKKNWVQEFELGLGPFLKSKKNTYKFIILNPKNFKIHDMVATKQGIETIDLEGKSVKAMKVKVTLAGFKSMFWKAQLWYDPQNLNMLIFKANEGPHTPTTTITLISNEGNPNAWYHTMWDKFKGEESQIEQKASEEKAKASAELE